MRHAPQHDCPQQGCWYAAQGFPSCLSQLDGFCLFGYRMRPAAPRQRRYACPVCYGVVVTSGRVPECGHGRDGPCVLMAEQS